MKIKKAKNCTTRQSQKILNTEIILFSKLSVTWLQTLDKVSCHFKRYIINISSIIVSIFNTTNSQSKFSDVSTIQTGSPLCNLNSLWSRQFTAPSFIVPRCCDIAAVLRWQSKLNTLLCQSLLTFKSLGREAGLYFCLALSSKDYEARGVHIKQQSNPWCAFRRALLTSDQRRENTALSVWNCWLVPGSKNQDVRFTGMLWQKTPTTLRAGEAAVENEMKSQK